MNKTVIIGATSGIGLEIGLQFLRSGYTVAGCGRNEQVLQQIKRDFPQTFFYEKLDLRDTSSVPVVLNRLIERMGGMELCVISAGISEINKELDWQIEENILQTNIMGFSAAAIFAANYFLKLGRGHLAGISSIAKFFGYYNPAYSASKAFEDIYLKGLALRLKNHGLKVSVIIPGFVRTPIIEGQDRAFWITDVKKAAAQIIKALHKKKSVIYISRRWRLIAWMLYLLPDKVLYKIL